MQQKVIHFPDLPGPQYNPSPLTAGTVRIFEDYAAMGVKVIKADF
jgi:hypothetical protein